MWGGGHFIVDSDDRQGIVPPAAVLGWAGLRTPEGEFYHSATDGFVTLSVLNDEGMPFAAIADMIEYNVDEL